MSVRSFNDQGQGHQHWEHRVHSMYLLFIMLKYLLLFILLKYLHIQVFDLCLCIFEHINEVYLLEDIVNAYFTFFWKISYCSK